MRVLVRHGHFAFYPKVASEIGKFTEFFQEELVRVEDYFTFSFLKDAEDYSLLGKPYLGVPALKNFEGEPWEVMKANDFVYNIALGLVVPKLSVVQVVKPIRTTFYYVAEAPLIQPGSYDGIGTQILSYDAELEWNTKQLRVREFLYE